MDRVGLFLKMYVYTKGHVPKCGWVGTWSTFLPDS